MNAPTNPKMNGNGGDGGTARLERNGEKIRTDMGRTLEELERKLSPREMMKSSMQYVRENGSGVAHDVGAAMRKHPLPILVTAAGLLWLTGSLVKYRSRLTSGAVHNSLQTLEDAADDGGPSDLREAADSSARLGAEAADELSTQRRRFGWAVRSRINAAVNSMRNRTTASARTVRHGERRAADEFTSLVREQPLVLGALALAAGALIGAVLPMTEYERRMMSGTHPDAGATPTDKPAPGTFQ